ncbi:MAG TPA: UvrD-helicase domain-containing protein [Planctomycetota bacterium]|nr:UvrD-helicase domain-containing protein [Planctomycetota bacterium]
MDPLLDDTNPEQRAAILHDAGPLLVVAGAGSGKTRVITRRVARLVRDGAQPREVLALTFTNKAAKEMRERVEKLVPVPDLWVCTFHGFAARVLRRFGDRVGYGREFTIYDTEDRASVLKQVLKEQGIDDLTPGEVGHAISRVKNGLDRAGAVGWRAERVTAVMRLYGERLRAANAMDFDDLLLNLLRLLDEDADARARLEARARWLLVDEYQDTNSVQYRILKALSGSERNVCATGDPDQSIYRWRGATIRNILDFERDFPGARVLTLDRNYRSTQAILDVANAVIRHNRDRYEKELRTENPPGARVREVRCGSDEDEAIAVVGEVRARIAAGRRPRDIAVFYRTNAQSRMLERAMALSGIPYRVVGAVEFYRRAEVKDILAYVRLARNPLDVAALRRILNVPARGLGAAAEERLLAAAAAKGTGPREVLRDAAVLSGFGRSRKAIEGFAALLARIETLPAEDPARFVEGVIEETQYRNYLGVGTPRAEVDRLGNVDELLNAAAEYARREPEGGIDGFLEENALVSDQDAYDGAADAVSLMTVHSAKGLEFPCVLVTGLEEQVLPHALSLDTPEEIEEERRLFYVAVTRAREDLLLLHGARRMQRGQVLPSLPSRFLEEVPDGMLEVVERTGGWVSEDEAIYRVEEETEPFRAGDRVRHHHFGLGRVVAVRPGGGGTRVTVEFSGAGRRDLLLSYARLERV